MPISNQTILFVYLAWICLIMGRNTPSATSMLHGKLLSYQSTYAGRRAASANYVLEKVTVDCPDDELGRHDQGMTPFPQVTFDEVLPPGFRLITCPEAKLYHVSPLVHNLHHLQEHNRFMKLRSSYSSFKLHSNHTAEHHPQALPDVAHRCPRGLRHSGRYGQGWSAQVP